MIRELCCREKARSGQSSANWTRTTADTSPKVGEKERKLVYKSYNYLLSDEMISVITDCDHFSGDKVRQKLVLYKQIRTLLGHLLYNLCQRSQSAHFSLNFRLKWSRGLRPPIIIESTN